MSYRIIHPILFSFSLFTATLSPAAESIIAAGITESIHDVLLSSPVAGIVSKHHFKPGSFVKEGEVILELDKRLEEFELKRRQLLVDARKHDLVDLQTLLEKSKGISKDEVDKAELDYKVAVVEHQMADEQLSKRIIRAPFTGTITEFAHDPGEATEAYQPLVRVVDTRRCYFVSNVDAKAAANLKLNQTVHLEIDTGATSVKVSGQISYLAPVVDPASGLLKIKILFENPDGKVRPGLAGVMRPS